MATTRPTVAVSAPGKVLLTGGYLVLDRQHTGLVCGLSARINVVAGEITTGQGVQLSEMVVDSPQFVDAQWRYGYHLAAEGGGIEVTQLQVGSKISRNVFVETTLSYVLTYVNHVWHQAIGSARLIILADNDYYSQTPTSTTPTPRFARFAVPLPSAHKTGLGSSAALVTAITAALLSHYLAEERFSVSTVEGRATLHNLAQAAHCAAQGKVGSGEEDGETCRELWQKLQMANDRLAAHLREATLEDVPSAIDAIRSLLREMGRLSNVPIEPASQTELLDAVSAVPGVYGGVVPGAGGYDALAVLARDDGDTRDRLEARLRLWTEERGTRVRVLSVGCEDEGVRAEDLDVYGGWL
ncbi:hypothetical protein CDD80_3639 [Ophiocordyceps camponoti-rufipedis]|uniref:phosphomevalonate kinase n=1 Tax=Ophiocordyceps camponoti-rufipedis TaxID=2004952 RepID=A0A2C5Y6H6_9HYPO|nr:hypothetical protein CDD80_3639 [Ophiocordyceps camponoti-rufipedis]